MLVKFAAFNSSTRPTEVPFNPISTPNCPSKFDMVTISAKCGTFPRVSVSSVNKQAAKSGKAAFFAPLMGMRPLSV